MNYFKKYDRITGWLVFAIAAAVYLLTMEPTASLWDCAEFIATSYKLEVGLPPGAPLFMMISRFFTLFAPGAEYAAVMVNTMSSLASAFTILFLFWSITHLGRRITANRGQELTPARTWTILGAGIVGALAYAFTDTFWFSAIEGEVYALFSFFTAVVVWAILKWEEVADEPHANRWLVLIAYLMGLSIGVHLLNLLAIPAIVFIYYFKKTPKVTAWGVVKATLIAAAILLFINNIVIPYTVAAGAVVDRWFVNGLGLPVNSGLLTFVLLLITLVAGAVYLTYRKGMAVWNTILLCLGVILIGYSSYASVVIRAAANPPMNSNNPGTAYGLLYFLNRDQYGSVPLLTGAQFSTPDAPIEDVKYAKKYYLDTEGKYRATESVADYTYPAEFVTLFPRMWSTNPSHIEGYKQWSQMDKGKTVFYKGERYEVPTGAQNLRYFFSYQMNFMYWRYFLWNFVGRQSDNQSYGEITDGQWLSGIGTAVYTLVRCPELRARREERRITGSMLRELLSASVLTCLQQSVMNLGILMVQGRINSFGPVIMAAFAAAVKIDSFAYMPLQDFGNAFSTFIAQNYGAQQPERIRRGIRTAVILSSVFAVCVSACVVLLAAPLLGLFLQPGETEILQAGVTYLRIAGAFYVGIGGLFLLYGLYRAVGRPGMSLVLTVISLGTRVALAYALSAIPSIGVVGIWWSIPIGWALADLTGVLVWRRAGRKLTENSHPGAKMR